jgi:hypothetical protein
MANWCYDEPTDETAEYNRRVVYTEAMIIRETKDYWTILGDKKAQMCVEEWVIVHWAYPTDMPPGVYVSKNRG